MGTATLDRTGQALEALESANTIRVVRKETQIRLRELGRRDGARLLSELVLNPPSQLSSLYVWQLLHWLPGVGDAGCRDLLRKVSIDPWCKVGRMTARQRDGLAERLRERAAGPPRRPSRARLCRECGEPMMRRSDSGCCGFCAEEMAA